MPKFTLLFATTNLGKLAELTSLVKGTRIEVVGLHQVPLLSGIEVEETGTTFEENARLKAQQYGQMSGLVTVADDSGLSVDALQGQPGVYSKRYGYTDTERIHKLLAEMKDIPAANRTAHFTAALALYNPASDKTIVTLGEAPGLITSEPHGSNGFGYDPIFFSNDLQKTFAEALPEEKNRVSHRGQAFQKMLKHIKKFAR